jgi:hypothetical protein
MENVEKTAKLLAGINLAFLLRAEDAVTGCGGKFLHALLILGPEFQPEKRSDSPCCIAACLVLSSAK